MCESFPRGRGASSTSSCSPQAGRSVVFTGGRTASRSVGPGELNEGARRHTAPGLGAPRDSPHAGRSASHKDASAVSPVGASAGSGRPDTRLPPRRRKNHDVVRALETVNHRPIQKKRRNQSQKKGPETAARSLSDPGVSSAPPTHSAHKNRSPRDRAGRGGPHVPRVPGPAAGQTNGAGRPGTRRASRRRGQDCSCRRPGGLRAAGTCSRSQGVSTRRGAGREGGGGRPRNGVPAPRRAPGAPARVRGSDLKPERALPSPRLTDTRAPGT